MPEIGLGIGCERASYGALMREWLYWYDENNLRYPTPAERIDLERQRAILERDRATAESNRANLESQRADLESQRADRLAAQLQALGIEPE